jgi:predicted ester cyclase
VEESSEAKQVVRCYLADVLNDRDAEAAQRLIANETLRQRVAAFTTAFPDLGVATEELIGEGDLVAAHCIGHGTHLGVFEGCPPTGLEWTARCTAIYRVRAGQIVDFRVNWDLLALMEQLGCIQRVATVSA